MKSSIFGLIVAALLVAAPSSVLASPIGKSLGNLRWGMSDTEVVLVVKRALKKEYAARYKKAAEAVKAQEQARVGALEAESARIADLIRQAASPTQRVDQGGRLYWPTADER